MGSYKTYGSIRIFYVSLQEDFTEKQICRYYYTNASDHVRSFCRSVWWCCSRQLCLPIHEAKKRQSTSPLYGNDELQIKADTMSYTSNYTYIYHNYYVLHVYNVQVLS